MSFQTDFEGTEEVMSEINMTPLVDVMLVLLIIFIITMPVINQAVKLNLPQANSPSNDHKPRHINVSIDPQGNIFWDKEKLDRSALSARLQQAALETPQPEIHLRADTKTAYDPIAKLLASAQQAGLSKVAFATQAEP